jgi:2-keto-4-pentenoate hydratase/2-oxohepta-3-ene-1,7-dioic acid hydratase in catechol pathway
MAFEDHAAAGAKRRGEELAQVWYERPVYYKGNPLTVIGHEAPIRRPAFTSELDLELEIACILGLPLLDATEGEAAEAIFGFTIMCDWSARDVQRVEMAARLGPAKSKDFATSLGPGIVTADEVGAHPALEMIARVNGESLATANLKDAYWSFPKMLSFVSQGEQLHPGEVFGSGTPFGGCLLDQEAEKWLEPGDVVELEVSSIGVLRNAVYQG